MAVSRISNSLKNAKVSVIFFALALVLSFFSRKVFLNFLGDNFVGLSTTLQNILGFLNIAEMGIGVAIASSLYRPLYNDDKEEIKEIVTIFGYFYRLIGLFVFGAGILLSVLLPWIIPADQFDTGVVFAVYYAFLLSSLLSYFVNYKQILLTADQKNYVVIACTQTLTIFKTLVQMGAAYYLRSYYAWVGLEVAAGVLTSIFLHYRVSKYYPWLQFKISDGKSLLGKFPNVTKSCKRVFFHRLGSFAEWQATPLLIYYSVSSLGMVTAYCNYSMIADKAISFCEQAYGSSISSVGNLIAEGKKDKIYAVFLEFFSLRAFFATLVACSFYYLSDSFIQVWLGNNYILPQVIVQLIALRLFILQISGAVSFFVTAHGLFWDIWAPFVQVFMMIACSLLLGIHYGIGGVLIGNIVSYFIVYTIWKAVLLYRWGFNKSPFSYFLRIAGYSLIASVAYGLSSWLSDRLSYGSSLTFDVFLYKSILYLCLLLLITICMYLLFSSSFRRLASKLLCYRRKK